MSVSEIVTLSIFKSFTKHNSWKSFYLHIKDYHKKDFPNIPNYQNFIKSVNKTSILGKEILNIFMMFFRKQTPRSCCKITDSTKLSVCHNKRIFNHKVTEGYSKRDKSSMGWFYGFKLHIICNEKTEILKTKFTGGNKHDGKTLEKYWNNIFGMILADAGYVGKDLFKKAKGKGIHLFTCVKANMKKLMTKQEQKLLKKRSLVETVFSVLKSRMNLETTLPRSMNGYLSHYTWTVLTYQFKKYLENVGFTMNLA